MQETTGRRGKVEKHRELRTAKGIPENLRKAPKRGSFASKKVSRKSTVRAAIGDRKPGRGKGLGGGTQGRPLKEEGRERGGETEKNRKGDEEVILQKLGGNAPLVKDSSRPNVGRQKNGTRGIGRLRVYSKEERRPTKRTIVIPSPEEMDKKRKPGRASQSSRKRTAGTRTQPIRGPSNSRRTENSRAEASAKTGRPQTGGLIKRPGGGRTWTRKERRV